MLYLVQPHGHLQWADLPAGTIQLAQERGVDLARLPWHPAREIDPGIVVELALRHGVACSLGLVIDARYVAGHTHAADGAAEDARTALGQHNEFMQRRLDEYMEHLFPDWTEQRQRLEGGEDGPTVTAAEGLAAPVKPEVSAKWRELGGVMPD